MLVNLNDVLPDAKKNHYAVGLFNTTDTDMLEAVISAAEEQCSPVIIGTAEVLLPFGELSLIAPSLIAKAKDAKVPVVVNFDHGLTFDRCLEALKLGFTSVMFDASLKDYSTNIAETVQMVQIAHAMGAAVEGEIGHIGNNEGSAEGSSDEAELHTTVQEAADYYSKTGVDALAVAIGTAHGAYKHAPKLNFQRLREINSAIDVPLVLHGGSGLTDDDFRTAIACGISKVNIYTDLTIAACNAMQEGLSQGLGFLEIRKKRVEYIKAEALRKIKLFGSSWKA